ncbi:MAG: transglutaminase-like domain-containing protein [Promethearchaeati archaeon]
MNLKSDIDFKEYLKPTNYCDHNNKKIIAKVNELNKNDDSPKEKALSIFYFVRDKVKFMLNDFIKASEVLKRGNGDCGGKSNLQVALLRAASIPARFHIFSLTKESLKGVVPNTIYKIMPLLIENHPCCECYLSENWIACDTLFDKSLMQGFLKKEIYTKEQIPMIDWDGENDLNTMVPWIIKDKGIYPSLDEIIDKAETQSQDMPEDLKNMLTQKLTKHLEKLRNLR